MKHYKLPELIAANFYDYGIDESKLTEQDCVNEAGHELEVMREWEWDGNADVQYGDNYGKFRRQLTSYLTRQRKRGIVPNGDYEYMDDPAKKL